MRKYLKQLLAKKARGLIEKYNPIIVAVTGSVGKTSTRHSIATILSAKYSVRTPTENYNNEIGVPLAILGVKSPGRSIFGWLRVLLTIPKNIPQVFVLEYGIDHPGDMEYLCKIVKPDVAVMTAISPVHLEFFRSIEQLVEEKAHLFECVKENGIVVLNADDVRVMGTSGHSQVPVVTYGFKNGSDIHATDYSLETRIDFDFQPGEMFSTIHLSVQSENNNVVSIELKDQLGKGAVSSLLAAIAIAKHLGLSWDEILSKVQEIKNEPGRMNPIPGIKGSLIIDSSYNAAPASMVESLHVLKSFATTGEAKRIAVLGHMAELGTQTESEHRMIGMRVAELDIDELVTVGDIAHEICRAAIEFGFDETHTQQFSTPEEAGRWLDNKVRKGDIVLVKGSQSARMEKVVKDIMAEPIRAKELLVRQYGKWSET